MFYWWFCDRVFKRGLQVFIWAYRSLYVMLVILYCFAGASRVV